MLTCHEICGMTRTNAFARCCVCFDGVEGKRSLLLLMTNVYVTVDHIKMIIVQKRKKICLGIYKQLQTQLKYRSESVSRSYLNWIHDFFFSTMCTKKNHTDHHQHFRRPPGLLFTTMTLFNVIQWGYLILIVWFHLLVLLRLMHNAL